MDSATRRRMAAVITFAFALAAPSVAAQEDRPPSERRWTLDAALAAALERSPEIAAAAAAVEEARARLTTARTYPHNPEIELEGAERSGPDGSDTDRSLAISQEIETAGRRAKRTAVARSALEAAEARLNRRRLEVTSAVTRVFTEALLAGELRELAASEAELMREMVELEERRLEAGAGTQLALNVARAAAGLASRRLHESTADWLEARARLAEAIGIPAIEAPQPEAAGAVPAPASDASLEPLIARALAGRWDLRALRDEVESARRQVALERALGRPNLRVAAFSGREEGADVVGAAVTVPIPLFDRNRGGVAEASAAVDRAAAELAVGREVAVVFAHYQAAAAAYRDLRDLVVGTLEESLDLLRRALEAGKIGTTEVLLLRRELFDARREALGALGEALVARTELELAVGSPDVLPVSTPGDVR